MENVRIYADALPRSYHSVDILQQMCRYRIGAINEPWIDLEPPISRTSFNLETTDGSRPFVPVLGQVAAKTNPKDKHVQSVVTDISHVPDTSTTPQPEWLELRSNVTKQMREDSDDHTYSSALDHLRQLEIDLDQSEYPAADAATQRAISLEFRDLHQTVRERGLYTCRLSNYAKELVRYSTLFSLFVVAFRYGWTLTSAVFLGLFWHQIMFSAHDAGHLSITHNFKIDTAIGIFIADFCCGLSMGWWKSSHNVHHLVPNHPEHDPDIQNVPLFSTSSTFCKSLRSTYYGSIFPWDKAADIMVRIQEYTYYPVMGLARFNLYFLSWGYLISDKATRLPSSTWTRPLEGFCMLCYWYMFGYRLVWLSIPSWPLRIGFVLISHIATMPLHVQITLSHWGMSTTDLGSAESFAQKQLRTTMDVNCPAWLDFIHGGLQFQAVHHLFPRLPRHNLREAQSLVRDFCKRVGVKYTIFNFVEGNEVVLGRLGEISKQLEILALCQRDMSLNKV